jgi:adenylyltransferase/sulfurtransferase
MQNSGDWRHARHIGLPGFGQGTQERLGAARVLVAGAGGVGSPAALYLAAAGVGCLLIADCDTVVLSNLNRQILHGTADLGRPKTESARDRLAAIDPGIRVETAYLRLDRANLPGLLAGVDLVIDALDNLAGRLAVNDACLAAGIPLVEASAAAWDAQVLHVPPGGPCLRCLYGAAADATAARPARGLPIIGAAAGLAGCAAACDAIAFLAGAAGLRPGLVRRREGRTGTDEAIAFNHRPACPACGDGAAPGIRADEKGLP